MDSESEEGDVPILPPQSLVQDSEPTIERQNGYLTYWIFQVEIVNKVK